MAYRSFEDREVWQRACRLAVRIYDVLQDCRDYGLKDQMTRSAVSMASNIAEGADRDLTAEFVRFPHIVKGSASELCTRVYIGSRINLISSEAEKELTPQLKTISSMIHSLVRFLRLKT